jgi:hypothetical protein
VLRVPALRDPVLLDPVLVDRPRALPLRLRALVDLALLFPDDALRRDEVLRVDVEREDVERAVVLLRVLPPRREPLRPPDAAPSREISLLKLLFSPPAVVSWCSSASPFSSNERNQSSQEISSSESAPEYPGKSSRIMPGSSPPPVPRTHAGRAPRSSAQLRISS